MGFSGFRVVDLGLGGLSGIADGQLKCLRGSPKSGPAVVEQSRLLPEPQALAS